VERSEPTVRNSYRSLVGKPGVVYVLENDGLRHGWLKIGCSTRSGIARALDLNADANTGTPGAYRCVYQVRTVDCGTAEQEVFARLSAHRRGKWGQEFFEVDLALAKEAIRMVCSAVDQRGAADPAPPSATPAADRDILPSTSGIAKPQRPLNGFAARRAQWRQPFRRPRRSWVAPAIVVGVLVVIAAGLGGQQSQPTNSRPSVQAAKATPKPAMPATATKPGVATQTADGMARPGGPHPAAPAHATTGAVSDGDTGTPSSATHGKSADAGAATEAATASSNSRGGETTSSSRSERNANAASCSSERMMQDPVAYSRCMAGQPP